MDQELQEYVHEIQKQEYHCAKDEGLKGDSLKLRVADYALALIQNVLSQNGTPSVKLKTIELTLRSEKWIRDWIKEER